MGSAPEASSGRIRYHLRRPIPGRGEVLTRNARNTVKEIVPTSRPERAIEALAIIEEAATRTLNELRDIVGVLRASQDTEFAPQPGMAEVEQLATDGQAHPCVKVALFGQFDDLSPAVGAVIYRLAQESITNARRHARHATQVTVTVTGDADRVRLTIDNDGSAGRFVSNLSRQCPTAWFCPRQL